MPHARAIIQAVNWNYLDFKPKNYHSPGSDVFGLVPWNSWYRLCFKKQLVSVLFCFFLVFQGLFVTNLGLNCIFFLPLFSLSHTWVLQHSHPRPHTHSKPAFVISMCLCVQGSVLLSSLLSLPSYSYLYLLYPQVSLVNSSWQYLLVFIELSQLLYQASCNNEYQLMNEEASRSANITHSH